MLGVWNQPEQLMGRKIGKDENVTYSSYPPLTSNPDQPLEWRTSPLCCLPSPGPRVMVNDSAGGSAHRDVSGGGAQAMAWSVPSHRATAAAVGGAAWLTAIAQINLAN